VRHELDVDEGQVLEDLRKALGVPNPDDVWAHTSETWTIRELCKMLGVSDATARRSVAEALDSGTMVEGQVHSSRGHYVTAYRLAED